MFKQRSDYVLSTMFTACVIFCRSQHPNTYSYIYIKMKQKVNQRFLKFLHYTNSNTNHYFNNVQILGRCYICDICVKYLKAFCRSLLRRVSWLILMITYTHRRIIFLVPSYRMCSINCFTILIVKPTPSILLYFLIPWWI